MVFSRRLQMNGFFRVSVVTLALSALPLLAHADHENCADVRVEPAVSARLDAFEKALGGTVRAASTKVLKCGEQGSTVDLTDPNNPVCVVPIEVETTLIGLCIARLDYGTLCVPQRFARVRWEIQKKAASDQNTYIFGSADFPQLGIWLNRPRNRLRVHFHDPQRNSSTAFSWARGSSRTYGTPSIADHGHLPVISVANAQGAPDQPCLIVDPPILNTTN
jgi:hypothetical protein